MCMPWWCRGRAAAVPWVRHVYAVRVLRMCRAMGAPRMRYGSATNVLRMGDGWAPYVQCMRPTYVMYAPSAGHGYGMSSPLVRQGGAIKCAMGAPCVCYGCALGMLWVDCRYALHLRCVRHGLYRSAACQPWVCLLVCSIGVPKVGPCGFRGGVSCRLCVCYWCAMGVPKVCQRSTERLPHVRRGSTMGTLCPRWFCQWSAMGPPWVWPRSVVGRPWECRGSSVRRPPPATCRAG